MPKFFTIRELQIMDDLTANNETVLASLGGKPKIPAEAEEDGYGLERKFSERSGVLRQRGGSYHR